MPHILFEEILWNTICGKMFEVMVNIGGPQIQTSSEGHQIKN